MKAKLAGLYFALCTGVAIVLGLELVGQLLYLVVVGRPLYLNYDRPREILNPFRQHPFLVATLYRDTTLTDDSTTVTSTRLGTRETGANLGDTGATVVAVVGGSTTFGTGVSDHDSWPAALQRLLGPEYQVINYGMPGFSTAEAIIQMTLLVPDAKPDIVVFYEGWNDIHSYYRPETGPDYYAHGMNQFVSLHMPMQPGQQPPTVLDRLVRTTAHFRLADKIIDVTGLRRPARYAQRLMYATPDSLVDRVFVRNLHTLKAVTHHLDASALFVPQMLNFEQYRGRTTSRGFTPHIVDSAMPSLMLRFDSLMFDVCEPGDGRCRIARDVLDHSWVDADFIDDGHFNRRGGERFAAIIAPHIRTMRRARSR